MSKHKAISFIKSGFRLVGAAAGVVAFWDNFYAMHAFAILFVAEIFGIAEEFFEVAPHVKKGRMDSYRVPEDASPSEIITAWKDANLAAGKHPNTVFRETFAPIPANPEAFASAKAQKETFQGSVPKMEEIPLPAVFAAGAAHEPKGS